MHGGLTVGAEMEASPSSSALPPFFRQSEVYVCDMDRDGTLNLFLERTPGLDVIARGTPEYGDGVAAHFADGVRYRVKRPKTDIFCYDCASPSVRPLAVSFHF